MFNVSDSCAMVSLIEDLNRPFSPTRNGNGMASSLLRMLTSTGYIPGTREAITLRPTSYSDVTAELLELPARCRVDLGKSRRQRDRANMVAAAEEKLGTRIRGDFDSVFTLNKQVFCRSEYKIEAERDCATHLTLSREFTKVWTGITPQVPASSRWATSQKPELTNDVSTFLYRDTFVQLRPLLTRSFLGYSFQCKNITL